MTLDTSHWGGGGGVDGLLTGFEAPFPWKRNIEFQMFLHKMNSECLSFQLISKLKWLLTYMTGGRVNQHIKCTFLNHEKHYYWIYDFKCTLNF